MDDLNARIRATMTSVTPAIVARIVEYSQTERSPESPPYDTAGVEQMAHGMLAVIYEALEGDVEGPARDTMMKALTPSLRAAGTPAVTMLSKLTGIFAEITATVVAELPRESQRGATRWFGYFVWHYTRDLMLTADAAR